MNQKINLTHITSTDNSQYKTWKSLTESSGIKKEKLCIVSGRKLIQELTQEQCKNVKAVLFLEKKYQEEEKISSFFSEKICFLLSANLFKELDVLGTQAPLLIYQIPELKTLDLIQEPQGLEVLCPLGDPINVGALIRTSLAFTADKIILLKESANPFLPKAIKASSGASLRAPLYLGPSIQELPLAENVWSLSAQGRKLHNTQLPKNLRLLVGEEGPGLPQKLKINTLAIEMNPSVESLNATVSSAIALYEYRKQHS